MSTINGNRTVGELVVERPARARIFERFGIDYCCGGRLPLAEACAKRGLDAEQVLEELSAGDRDGQSGPEERDWSAASPAELADHIESTHHAWLRRELPRLRALTTKVADAHGQRKPELVELRNLFEQFVIELNSHMLKEERVLFPWIRRMVQDGGGDAPRGIQDPVSMMIHEHDSAGNALQRMRELTDGFTPPLAACGSHRAMLDGLRELEADMHTHVHKENNILFPMALRLESQQYPETGSSCCCSVRGPAGG